MQGSRSRGVLLALACLLARPGAVRAQWPAANLGLAVCTAAGVQTYDNAISDGAGGMFVAWSDTRFVLSDVYVQHVSASGAILWRVDGALGCGAANRQNQVALVSDGAGGLVLAWRDFRYDSEGDIFAQRIDPNGVTAWTFNGVPICTSAGQQATPAIAVDIVAGTSRGYVIAWEDDRAVPRIYAQRLDATGTALWTPNGVPASTSLAAQFEPSMITAGQFGVILAWSQQGDAGYDIYAQNIGHEGQPLWDPAGYPVCVAAGNQYRPVAVSDSASGAWFAWQDDRAASIAVYAQRVTLPGFSVVTGDGVPVCSFNADQRASRVVADGRGGLLVGWADARLQSDIYAQRLDPTGARLWSASGEVVCNGPGTHAFPSIAADGRGGALLAWEDDRNGGGTDIYAQRIDSLGAARWTPGGIGACTASSSQYQPTVVSNPDTAGIVIWQDLRGSTDLYCQRIPIVVAAPRVPVPMVASPNPAFQQSSLEFALAGAGRAELEIYDAAGRRVRTLANATLEAGTHRVPWDARDDSGRSCAEGVYFARLTLDGRALATRSITILR